MFGMTDEKVLEFGLDFFDLFQRWNCSSRVESGRVPVKISTGMDPKLLCLKQIYVIRFRGIKIKNRTSFF